MRVWILAAALGLSGCGMGSAVGGTVGAVAGGAVDLVLRDTAWDKGMKGLSE